MKKAKGFTTKIIHTGYLKKDSHRALQFPIYNSAAYEFESAEQIEQAFRGQIAEHSYTRSSSPTVENFEQRIKAITDAWHVTALSSGMAALTNTIFTLAYQGANLVTSKNLFGNTFSFFQSTIHDFGVDVRFCDLNNRSELEEAIDSNTCAVFFETITNPQLEIVDVRKLSEIAKKKQVPLIADTTLTPFHIFKAKEFGVNLEIVSSTKIISGGSVGVGGLIIDYGNFDWTGSAKLKTVASSAGTSAFNFKLRREVFKNLGACMAPFTAYFHSVGLETLKLRYDKAASNCIRIAQELSKMPQVKAVNHPSLPDSPFHAISKLQFGELPTSLLTFDLASKEETYSFMNKLSLVKRATNLYDNKTLIIHPSSTIYCDFTDEVKASIGIRDTMMRLSVGIEDVDDILDDICQALNK